jgi:hypothetical protein
VPPACFLSGDGQRRRSRRVHLPCTLRDTAVRSATGATSAYEHGPGRRRRSPRGRRGAGALRRTLRRRRAVNIVRRHVFSARPHDPYPGLTRFGIGRRRSRGTAAKWHDAHGCALNDATDGAVELGTARTGRHLLADANGHAAGRGWSHARWWRGCRVRCRVVGRAEMLARIQRSRPGVRSAGSDRRAPRSVAGTSSRSLPQGLSAVRRVGPPRAIGRTRDPAHEATSGEACGM